MDIFYLMREGFVDLQYGEPEESSEDQFVRSVQLMIHKKGNAQIIRSNLGTIIIENKTINAIVIDADIVEKYGVKKEIVKELDIDEATKNLL